MRVSAVGCAVLCGVLSGCAHVPNVTVKYYLAQTKVSFRVVRTVSCDAKRRPVVVTTVTPLVTHLADHNQPRYVELATLSGALSDSDSKFEFYEDGRLSSVNAASTGQGEAVLKSVLTMAAAVIGLKSADDGICQPGEIAGDGKPLTVTYEGDVNVAEVSTTLQEIKPSEASRPLAESLHKSIGGVCAVVESIEKPEAPIAYVANKGDVLLPARHPGTVQIKVTAGEGGSCSAQPIWQGRLQVAQQGTTYVLPMPKSAVFGKLGFGASFAESGALTSLQYVNTSGAGQLMNVVGAAQSAVKPETTAQKAADVKAEADLIAQQQRLARCLADPKSCN